MKKVFIRKYYDQEHYFETWSSNMAYILAFIAADGSIYKDIYYRLSISLHQKDKEIIDFIKQELSPNRPIYYYTHKQVSGLLTPKVILKITNNYLCESLFKLGLCLRKTWDKKLPDIPSNFKADYLRGYFDADGSITRTKNGNDFIYKIRISCCCLDFLQQLKETTINIGRIYKGNHTWDWEICKKDEMLQFKHYIYNGNFCLQRKYLRFLLIKADQKTKKYIAFNEEKTLKEWLIDNRCKVNKTTLAKRIQQYNLPFELLLTTPKSQRLQCYLNENI